MFNIGMLKRVFNPTFELHDIKQTGEYEATTRWYACARARGQSASMRHASH